MKHSKQLIFEGGMVLILWMAHVFNPPPLASMNQRQKIARILVVACSLFLICNVAAVLLSLALVLAGAARELMREPTGAEIVLIGAVGNILCWRTLLAIKRSDGHLGW